MSTTPTTLADRIAGRGTLAFADHARTAPLGLVVGITAAGVLWIAHGVYKLRDERYRSMVARFDRREERAAERAADAMLGRELARKVQDETGPAPDVPVHPTTVRPARYGSALRESAKRRAAERERAEWSEHEKRATTDRNTQRGADGGSWGVED